MCLILFAYQTQQDLPLVIAANRDEQHTRESLALHRWQDDEQIIAGRDLVAGGTWLGCTQNGRFAALTNFSQPDDPARAQSRGQLVQSFLQQDITAEQFAHHIDGESYAGFNLLLWDTEQLVYTSNKAPTEVLTPGYYGLSNAELGAAWPKCLDGAQRLEQTVENNLNHDQLIGLLRDQTLPEDQRLPHRGRPLELERRIAPCFILGEQYGTRASSSLMIRRNGLSFSEQTYLASGQPDQINKVDLTF